MKRLGWLSLVAIFLFPGLQSCGGSGPFPQTRARIAETLADGVASISIAVARDGQVIWEEGFGFANKEEKIPATPDTAYSLASISKPFTATGLMILVDRGKVELDRPINDYLGETPLVSPLGHVEEATVRRVASHTAGLPLHYQFFYEDEEFRPPPRGETIRRYGKLVTLPGEIYNYSNLGFGILDYVISRVSKESYPEFMKKEVFEPLALTHTAVGPPDIDPGLIAVRYSQKGNPIPFYDFDHPGASAIYSSAHDLIRFALFHLNGAGEGQKDILTPSSRISMKIPEEGRTYAIGWGTQKRDGQPRTTGHTGGMGGVSTSMSLVPDRNVAVVVLSNSGSGRPVLIQQTLLHELLPDDFPAAASPRENDSPPPKFEPPQELLGDWRGEVETYVGNRDLVLKIEPTSQVRVRFRSGEWQPLEEVRWQDGFLSGEFPADIDTPDSSRRPHRLRLSLKLRGDHLNGACTAISLPAEKIGNALSHWVDLAKVTD